MILDECSSEEFLLNIGISQKTSDSRLCCWKVSILTGSVDTRSADLVRVCAEGRIPRNRRWRFAAGRVLQFLIQAINWLTRDLALKN